MRVQLAHSTPLLLHPSQPRRCPFLPRPPPPPSSPPPAGGGRADAGGRHQEGRALRRTRNCRRRLPARHRRSAPTDPVQVRAEHAVLAGTRRAGTRRACQTMAGQSPTRARTPGHTVAARPAGFAMTQRRGVGREGGGGEHAAGVAQERPPPHGAKPRPTSFPPVPLYATHVNTHAHETHSCAHTRTYTTHTLTRARHKHSRARATSTAHAPNTHALPRSRRHPALSLSHAPTHRVPLQSEDGDGLTLTTGRWWWINTCNRVDDGRLTLTAARWCWIDRCNNQGGRRPARDRRDALR